ncbi:helicase-related protein [Dehalobacter sp.]|uniref:DEAD/DEAH box helicase n=1 Tax=Dehalobacter sp. TaxID=1962289 RepID=UPI00258D3BBD|nr:helicase-related protein [Dehalobacter sp.]MDJ0306796.1 helicase-related protein [Dehalobacter sp.]
MFTVGQHVFDTMKKERVQIMEVSEAWGYVSYKVFNASAGTVYKLAADDICIEAPEENYNEIYLRYVALLSKIKNETAGGILSKLSSGIIPLPHQLHVLNRALSDNNVRYILADEVGLGKTIEAGLIIKELKTRGLIKRILIVCPTGLVTQWSLEMQEKFAEKFNVILPEDYETIRKITDKDDVYGQFDQVISPMDSIKPLERRVGWTAEKIEEYNEERIYSIINSGWDLVVIDEAHRVAGSSGEVARYKLGNLLSAASPYLLLLTATPHNGKTEPFLRLVRLIDEKAFPNINAVVKEQVAPYIIRTEKREAIDNSGNKLFKNRSTKAIELHWDERHSLQRKLYEMVSEYVSKNYNKAMRNRGKNMWFVFLLIMMQRLVTSSTSAVRESMERRIKVLEDQAFKSQFMTEEEFAEMELEENMEDAIAAISLDIKEEIAQLDSIIAIAKQAEFQYLDVKIEPLLEIIDGLFVQERKRKVIIFTEFVATQKYLQRLLQDRGYSISILNGSMNIEERNAVLQEFKKDTDILISTDAGGEGLNLQFSNCVINYDLPWNPMKIEQRIGRVDRIGQQSDVFIFNFTLADTVENRVKDVLEEKLSIILKEIGVDKYSDVLDSETAELNFTDAYMNSIRNPQKIEFSIGPVEEDLKKQVQNTMRVKDLIKEEKDLTSMIGTESTFDFEAALRQMVTYYENFKGNPYLAIEEFSINDSVIISHLNKEIEQEMESYILKVTIKDFPNEKGYFMLWQLSVSSDSQGQKIIPIFVNQDFILRPMAGKKLWEAILDPTKLVTAYEGDMLDRETWSKLYTVSQEFTYDIFLALKTELENRNEETYRKYLYALNLRVEAAQHIGIENIRQHKLMSLGREKAQMEANYQSGKKLCPEFKLIMMVYME